MTTFREAFAAYIAATNTHDFDRVAPFIHPEATYWFGPRCHARIEEVRVAFEHAWAVVADEVYEVRDCRWLMETDGFAVVTYRYRWRGVVQGAVRTGGGLGTNVLKNSAGRCQVLHEHLSPQSAVLQSSPEATAEATRPSSLARSG